jgi:hypothetical protein
MPSKAWKRLDGTRFLVESEPYAEATALWRSKRAGDAWSFRVKVDPMLESSTGPGMQDWTGTRYGGAVMPTYLDVLPPATRPLVVQTLFSGPFPANGNLVRIPKQDPETENDADVTGEGESFADTEAQLAPQDYMVVNVTAKRTISEDFLMDVPSASLYLTNRLGTLVQLAEEVEMLSGDGSTGRMLGVLNAADSTESATMDSVGSSSLGTAMTAIVEETFTASGLFPTWALLHPLTWFRLVTENPAAGTPPTFGPPGLADGRTFYGLRLALSVAAPMDCVVVGNEFAAAHFVHEMGLELRSSPGYLSHFGEGRVLVRGRIRSTLAWEYPSAIGILSLGS